MIHYRFHYIDPLLLLKWRTYTLNSIGLLYDTREIPFLSNGEFGDVLYTEKILFEEPRGYPKDKREHSQVERKQPVQFHSQFWNFPLTPWSSLCWFLEFHFFFSVGRNKREKDGYVLADYFCVFFFLMRPARSFRCNHLA